MVANYVSGPEFNLKKRKSVLTIFAIIGIPALVVLAIPDVGSLLVFVAFFITLYREGLNGWLFGAGFIFAVVFLISLAIDPMFSPSLNITVEINLIITGKSDISLLVVICTTSEKAGL